MTTKKQLHEVQDTAQELFEGAAKKGSDFYQAAKEWLPENYTNPWLIGSGVALVGIFGYLIGRSKPSSVLEQGEKPSNKFDEDRLMKFARIWLLYRATR